MLFACVLALRLLVPQGWMPVADVHGVRLTLCSGAGPMEMAPAEMTMPGMGAHHGGDHHPSQMPDHPCAFAGLGLALAEPLLPALALPPAVAEHDTRPGRTAVAIGRGLAAPPPPPTGPPALA